MLGKDLTHETRIDSSCSEQQQIHKTRRRHRRVPKRNRQKQGAKQKQPKQQPKQQQGAKQPKQGKKPQSRGTFTTEYRAKQIIDEAVEKAIEKLKDDSCWRAQDLRDEIYELEETLCALEREKLLKDLFLCTTILSDAVSSSALISKCDETLNIIKNRVDQTKADKVIYHSNNLQYIMYGYLMTLPKKQNTIYSAWKPFAPAWKTFAQIMQAINWVELKKLKDCPKLPTKDAYMTQAKIILSKYDSDIKRYKLTTQQMSTVLANKDRVDRMLYSLTMDKRIIVTTDDFIDALKTLSYL